MATCNTLIGIDKGCVGPIGGVARFYIINTEDFSGKTYDVDGVMTGGTLNTPLVEFIPYYKDNIDYVENETNENARLYDQTVTIQLFRRSADKRKKLALLTDGNPDLTIVIEANDGTIWSFGNERGLNLATNEGGSGKVQTDITGYLLTFKGQEKEAAPTIDPTFFATLL